MQHSCHYHLHHLDDQTNIMTNMILTYAKWECGARLKETSTFLDPTKAAKHSSNINHFTHSRFKKDFYRRIGAANCKIHCGDWTRSHSQDLPVFCAKRKTYLQKKNHSVSKHQNIIHCCCMGYIHMSNHRCTYPTFL